MKTFDVVELRELLLEMTADGGDELLSDLAGVFAAVLNSGDREAGCVTVREVMDKISTDTERLVSNRQSPTKMVEALVRIDVRLSEKKAIDAPFASRLAPLAMERALHAEEIRRMEERETELVSKSPVFRTDERTVFAVPVGMSSDEGFAAFSDRILTEVLKKRSKRVILVLTGLDPRSAGHRIWDALESDLKSHKVRLERIS